MRSYELRLRQDKAHVGTASGRTILCLLSLSQKLSEPVEYIPHSLDTFTYKATEKISLPTSEEEL